MSESGSEVLTKVSEALATAHLAGINFLEVRMERKPDVEPTEPGLKFPAAMLIGYQLADGAAVYRLDVSVDRPDLFVKVVVAVQYQMDTAVLADFDVAQKFGERVAIPALYPFARSKAFDLTTDCGAPPVLMDVLDMTRIGAYAAPQVS